MNKQKMGSKVTIMLLLSFLLTNCSLDKLITKKLASSIGANSAATFLEDDDPELVGDAFPVFLKGLEMILKTDPENRQILLATGSAFLLYTHAFVYTPASMLDDQDFDRKIFEIARAKNLFLRARGYVLKALTLKYPQFITYIETDNYTDIAKAVKAEDVDYLYTAGMAWMGAFICDPFDPHILITFPRAVVLIDRVLELDDTYAAGGAHEFFISYYGSLPVELGGDQEKARYHFNKAIEYSGGKKASPYVTLATTVSVANQNSQEFIELLEKAISLDVNAEPSYRLLNILTQRKAKWLLTHLDDYFLIGD